MAKGNMFQGMARGKVGDVVFTRRGGEQLSYAYNPHPRNVRSDQQLYQRAVWASCLRAYSAGKEIFDHAFEGYRKGAECMQRFMQLNAANLRKALIEDVKTGDTSNEQYGRFVPEDFPYAVPWYFQVSEGSLPQILGNDGSRPATTYQETTAHYCERIGLVPGDIFTTVFIQSDFPIGDAVIFQVAGTNSDLAKYTASKFGYIRYKVRGDVFNDNTKLIYFSQVFEYMSSVNVNLQTLYLNQQPINTYYGVLNFISLPYQTDYFGFAFRCFLATIHSRTNEGLRSTSFMGDNNFPVDIEPGEQYSPSLDFGQASNFVLEAWKQGTQVIPSP